MWFPYCQAQGPTLGPTQGQGHGQDMVMTWSGYGQVLVRSWLGQTPTPKWDLSYTLKLVSTHHQTSYGKFHNLFLNEGFFLHFTVNVPKNWFSMFLSECLSRFSIILAQ